MHRCCFPTPEAPYPAIYWPSAATESAASKIRITNSVVGRRYDFRLPPEVKSMVISGVALLADGNPAEGARIQISKLPDYAIVGMDSNSDAFGYFSFTAMAGLDY